MRLFLQLFLEIFSAKIKMYESFRVEIGHVYGNVIGEEMALVRLTDNHW